MCIYLNLKNPISYFQFFRRDFIAAGQTSFNPSRPYKTKTDGQRGRGRKTRTFYIYLNPNSSHCVCAGAKAQQSSSIWSLFVWLYSSRQENSLCCITRVVKHWESESRYRPEVKHIQLFYALWNRDGERREWDLRHYVYCNDTPPTARLSEWRDTEVCSPVSLLSCRHTVETLQEVLVVTWDCGWVLCEKEAGMLGCFRLTV